MAKIKHLRRLKQYIQSNNFDYIIDNRTRNSVLKEVVYLRYIYNQSKVIWVARSSKLSNYFTNWNSVGRCMIKKSHAVVGVSAAITQAINQSYQTNSAVCIHNPKPDFDDVPTTSAKPYILFLGRIVDEVKNLTLLLDGYQSSDLSTHGIDLKIYGDGEDKAWLKNQIETRGLQKHVLLYDFNPNINNSIKNAHFLVLTSHYEGFPRVLIESLSLGTPVVSVNCPSGPAEIVRHEENGLLVENYNPKALAEAMNRLIFERELYQKCKQNAISSIAHLDQSIIVKQWLRLFESGK